MNEIVVSEATNHKFDIKSTCRSLNKEVTRSLTRTHSKYPLRSPTQRIDNLIRRYAYSKELLAYVFFMTLEQNNLEFFKILCHRIERYLGMEGVRQLLDSKNEQGESVLVYAISKKCNINLMDYLFKMIGVENLSQQVVNREQSLMSFLFFSIENNNLEFFKMVKELLVNLLGEDQSCDLLIRYESVEEQSLLSFAVSKNSGLDIIKYLVETECLPITEEVIIATVKKQKKELMDYFISQFDQDPVSKDKLLWVVKIISEYIKYHGENAFCEMVKLQLFVRLKKRNISINHENDEAKGKHHDKTKVPITSSGNLEDVVNERIQQAKKLYALDDFKTKQKIKIRDEFYKAVAHARSIRTLSYSVKREIKTVNTSLENIQEAKKYLIALNDIKEYRLNRLEAFRIYLASFNLKSSILKRLNWVLDYFNVKTIDHCKRAQYILPKSEQIIKQCQEPHDWVSKELFASKCYSLDELINLDFILVIKKNCLVVKLKELEGSHDQAMYKVNELNKVLDELETLQVNALENNV